MFNQFFRVNNSLINIVYIWKYLGSQDDIAAKIKNETFIRITEMNKQVAANKHKVFKA